MKQDAFHCQDCEWSRTVGTVSSRCEATKGAISHHVETGHEIVSGERTREVPSAERILGPGSDPTPSATRSND